MALTECIRVEPQNGEAHMALAVSYTNELEHDRAYEALENWLRANPRYQSMIGPSKTLPVDPISEDDPFGFGLQRYQALQEKQEEVQRMYIRAAMASPDQVDADVQVGLGVLFNISHDYDKAVECFQTALQVRPKDSALWNKLGATLANGERSPEAIDSYRQALENRPGYIRARYNLGISCINLKAYHEAAEHFLTALSLQNQSAMSETIWNSLRMVLMLDDRRELAELTSKRNLDAFRQHFDFSAA